MIEKAAGRAAPGIQLAATAHSWMCYDLQCNWLFILDKNEKGGKQNQGDCHVFVVPQQATQEAAPHIHKQVPR
jgi:hypothetical protein